MAFIELTNGGLAQVDEADIELIACHKWRRLTAAKTYHYVATTTRSPVILLHRFLMRAQKGLVVDHINGDTLDNRRGNLRVCTHAENMRNKRIASNSQNQYKGVARAKKRWSAQIGSSRSGGRTHVGLFKTQEEAAAAYDIAAVLRYGEFACLNFPHVFPELGFRKAEKNLPEVDCETLRIIAKQGETM
jgi:hypothetical protein